MPSGDAGGLTSKSSVRYEGIRFKMAFIRCGFNNVDAFRAFCALGDIDPDRGRGWAPLSYIWMSRTKDVVIETVLDPLAEDGYCHFFGLTGAADKAVAMYNFMHDKHDDSDDAPAMTTIWTTIGWGREFI